MMFVQCATQGARASIVTVDGDPENRFLHPEGNQSSTSGGLPSFETVLAMFHKRVYNFAYRLLGNRDEAADLTQETFVKAYKSYSNFRGASQAVYPWLCRITLNNCKNKFKEMNRRGRYEAFSLDDQCDSVDSDAEFQIGDDSANPAGVFERRELETRIQDAIQSLPPEFRVVVVLRDMQGLSYKEIVDATGLTMENVKARLFRARAALRRKLQPYIKD